MFAQKVSNDRVVCHLLVDRRAYDEGAFVAEFVVRAGAEGDSERRVGAVVERDAGF